MQPDSLRSEVGALEDRAPKSHWILGKEARKAKARVVELADALGSGPSDRKVVGVQLPPLALLNLLVSPSHLVHDINRVSDVTQDRNRTY